MQETQTGTPLELTPANLQTFSDAFFAAQMEELHVPGVSFVVVQGQEVLYAQGYGVADLETNTPVSAQDTVFRVGSVTKLFTATAVMQLADQGLLDLHTDINTYLTEFQVETPFDQPVTLAHLLTHTAGLDEQYLLMHARTAEDYLPLGDYLAERLPPIHLPPGEIISYNDHGYTLAGYIVEEVSGLAFEDYLQQNILTPLDMQNSSIHQPAPEHILDNIATGYLYQNGQFSPYELDYVHVSPAASLNSTAADIANFIIAHLNQGQFQDAQILSPEATADMHQQQFTHHPALRGRTYGFSELFVNQQRLIFHDGGNPGFLNRLVLIPEQDLGFFITFNAGQLSPAFRLHRNLTTEFMNTFFPAEAPQPPTASPAVPDPQAYTGYYREAQAYSHDTLQKVLTLMNQFPVTTSPSGGVQVFGSELVQVEDNVFQWPDGDGHVVFKTDQDGKINRMFFGTGAFFKVPWYETQPFQYGLLVFLMLAFLAGIILPIFWGRIFHLPAFGSLPRGALLLNSAFNLTFLIGFGLAFSRISQWEFMYGLPPVVRILLILPVLAAVFALGLAGFSIYAWFQSDWRWLLKLYYTLAASASLACIWFLNFWNMLGWRY